MKELITSSHKAMVASCNRSQRSRNLKQAILVSVFRSLGSVFLIFLLFTINACGAGDSGANASPVNDDGGVTDQVPPDDDPSDDGLSDDGVPTLERHTISGELAGNDVFQADSDVNDPFTAASDNNSFATAQILPNPAIVKGFVTATPTGVDSDRFASTADVVDVFRISAFASQSIFLEIADFNTDAPGSVDLDIGLFDESGALLDVSLSVENSFESLLVPADGNYLLVVNAFSGKSNYTLSITTEFVSANFDSQISVDTLRLDQLTLTSQPKDIENREFVTRMRESAESHSAITFEATGATLSLDKEHAANIFANYQRKTGTSNGGKQKTLMSMHAPASVTRNANILPDVVSMLELIKDMNSREGADTFLPLDYPSTLQAFNSDPVPDRFIQWNLSEIGWTEAQNQLPTIPFRKRPIVAVIDSGFFVGHPDLEGVLVDQRDFVPGFIDGDGLIADASDDVFVNDDPACHSFHGTHVATIAAAPQNSIGVTGVAPGIGLVGIKVGHNTGQNCGLAGDIANAILYAAGLPNSSGSTLDTVADVINLSLGSRFLDPRVNNAVQRAVAQGVIVVAAAGNDGAPVRSFPAALNSVIAVAATDTIGRRTRYSSFYPEVDISAPGGDLSVDLNGDGLADGIAAGIATINGSGFQANWTLYQGTSMASPMVAAGFALMKGIEPSLTQSDIEALLVSGNLTVDIGAPGFDVETGFGLMSLPRMIESAVQFSGTGGSRSATIVSSTLASLDFGASLSEISFDLVQLGGERVSVESIVVSESLRLPDGTFPLRFTEPGTSDGFGAYSFFLERSALDVGALSGSLSFNLSNGTSYTVPVSVVSQRVQRLASSAAVFFIIERLNSDNVFEVAEQFIAVNGVREAVIESPELEEGTYRIVFGTDTDNDFLICDEGELCGTFPFNNFGFDDAFVLNENIFDASYLLQDVANIDLATFEGNSHSAVKPRSVVK